MEIKSNIRLSLILIASIGFILGSCIFVKVDEEDDIAPTIKLSPKPEISLSDQIVRSENGDMISFIPEGWFFIDTKEDVSSDIIAIAVNPEYTLAAVFSSIKKNIELDKVVEKEGLLGLARISMNRHNQKTAGQATLFGKYQRVEMGIHNFVKYNITTSGGALLTRAAVFQSALNNYYEFALVPMEFRKKKLPSESEINMIFRSIMTTIKCQ